MQEADKVHEAVRQHYGSIAVQNSSCCGPTSADCGCNVSLYDDSLTAGLPVDVTGLSLGCGDPVTIADLRPGETVLDLGSGGGIDCFIAARQVGPEGRVIGVDMTPQMIEKARANAAKIHSNTSNIEFRLGQIEAMPVEDSTVDVIISNCVINLSPDKPAVFREALRVLKPGGRVSISDIVTIGDLPELMRSNMNQWAECVSGAIDATLYIGMMEQAGFTDVRVVDKVTASSLIGMPGVLPKIVSARITGKKPE
jgi:SAM-dependent methyltransferase